MALLKHKKVHFIGIGGIGMSGVAKILRSRGLVVTGSDAADSAIIEELRAAGVQIKIGQVAENIPLDAEAVVHTSAVAATNPEYQEALRRHLPIFSYAEAVGEISRAYQTVAISGTHGKSTTTAMLGKILLAAGLDPLILVGTKVRDFSDGNVHLRQGKIFVVEACEHSAQMLRLHPSMIVLTNLESDHLDFYQNWENLRDTFRAYLKKVASKKIIANADDAGLREMLGDTAVNFYGTAGQVQLLRRTVSVGAQQAQILIAGQEMTMSLRLPGEFNIYNALAALTAAINLGVAPEIALAALAEFGGSWRRFENLGEWQGATIISDYGHHPTAVMKTMAAAREFFGQRRIILVFQPHQHHRTTALYADFLTAFAEPEILLLAEIYGVTGRTGVEAQEISSARLAADLGVSRGAKETFYAATVAAMEEKIRAVIQTNDVLLIMGAGDIFLLAEKLCSR